MKPIHLTTTSALALALVLGGPFTLAEQHEQQQNKQEQDSQAGGAQQLASASKNGTASNKMTSLDAEELEGATVVDRNGNDIGEIDELVRGKDGKSYAVISVGGFFDIGDKDIALPLDKLSLHGEAVVLPQDLSSVEQLKSFEEFDEDLYTEIEENDQVQLRRTVFATGKTDSAQTMTVAAEEIDGAEVVDRNSNHIGEVDEIVRGEDGKTYAVISVGGFFDIDDKDVALPLDRLSMWRDSVVLPQDLGSIDQLQDREEYNEDLYTEVEVRDQLQIERSHFVAMETDEDVAMETDEDGERGEDVD